MANNASYKVTAQAAIQKLSIGRQRQAVQNAQIELDARRLECCQEIETIYDTIYQKSLAFSNIRTHFYELSQELARSDKRYSIRFTSIFSSDY